MIILVHSPDKRTYTSLVKAGELLPSLFLCSFISLSSPGAYRAACTLPACSAAWWNKRAFKSGGSWECTFLLQLTVEQTPTAACQLSFLVSWISVGSLKVTFWPCITCSDYISSTTVFTKVLLFWQGHAIYHSTVCWFLPAYPHRKEVSVKVSSKRHMQQLDLLRPQHNP